MYEGEDVVVVPGAIEQTPVGRRMALELRGPDDAVRASGEAQLPDDPPDPGELPPSPTSAPPPTAQGRPEASPSSLAPGTALALPPHGFHADHASGYLAEIGERLPLYADEAVAHPGWLLRDANHVLSANVRLGPWIHTESVVQHHGVVRDGDSVAARAGVAREWERKGHRVVELDVALLAAGDAGDARDRLVARVTHTAIYRPRPAPADTA